MKTLLLILSLAFAGVSTASAQIYRPAIVNTTLWGGIAGAIIGGHNHDRWGEGALIGAVAGTILGAAIEPPVVYQSPPVTVVQAAPTVAAAPVVAAGARVFVQAPAQVVYVPAYYEAAPVVYAYPAVNVALGYGWGPRGFASFRSGHRRW